MKCQHKGTRGGEMQIITVSNEKLDVPALNYVISLSICYFASRGFQAIMQTTGTHKIPSVIGWQCV